ncbi:hypothetical protein TWF506_002626 [Arthrobotrys conoides]|uniref:DUF6314 domain-containing protein n=1 Tax=Arthrobotrys conoides TaxID=74498 RepID=A0AAN8N9E0_9PEZI
MTATAASIVFKCLSGTWTLRRTLTSAIPSFPSGTFTGSATFTPIPSSPSSPSDQKQKETLLYTETGELITTNGLTLRANKKYIYTYSPTDDKLSAWFVKESRGDDNQTKINDENNTIDGGNSRNTVEIDYLFHELVFGEGGEEGAGVMADGKWTAIGDHLCIKDNYSARYEFEVGKGEVRRWMLKYDVKGPAKDYISETRFER